MKIRALISERDLQFPEINHWRITKPMEFLKRNGIDAEVVSDATKVPADTNILILHKLYVVEKDRADLCKYFESLRDCGTRVVYDADDDMWSEDFVSYMTRTFTNIERPPKVLVQVLDELEMRQATYLWMVMQCDAVTVSNKNLAQYVTKISGKPVFVVENAIDVTSFINSLDEEKSLRKEDGTVSIGWAGGNRPVADLQPMFDAWKVVAAIHDNTRFYVSGYKPLSLNAGDFRNRLSFIKWTNVNEYGTNMQVDIGCCIVGDDNFSKRKSPIKAWEFGLAGAFTIGSDSLYEQEPIPIAKTVDDWVRILSWYVLDKQARENYAYRYKIHVRARHDIKFQWLYWADVYTKILNTVPRTVHDSSLVSV
jgi:hypothetical protein